MAKDSIHFVIREALEKDGWTITDDPFTLQTGDIRLEENDVKLLVVNLQSKTITKWIK